MENLLQPTEKRVCRQQFAAHPVMRFLRRDESYPKQLPGMRSDARRPLLRANWRFADNRDVFSLLLPPFSMVFRSEAKAGAIPCPFEIFPEMIQNTRLPPDGC